MNRITNAIRRDPGLWTARPASLVIFGYLYYTLATHYDLARLDDTPGFRLGILVAFSTIWVLAELLAIHDTIRRRRRKPSLPVHPDYPPVRMIYLQGEGEPERCACHNQPIEDGAEILHWPQPAKLVCADQDESR